MQSLLSGSTGSLLSPHWAQSVLPEGLLACGSREHPRGHTAHPGNGNASLPWKADCQQLGARMKSTSWVRSAISSSAQSPAPLQGMRRSISPLEHFPSEHSIQAIPSSEGFCTLWGITVLGAHGKDPQPWSSPHSAVAEGAHTGWTQQTPQPRAAWGQAGSS